MAEVTGNPPVEYRAATVEAAPGVESGWQTQNQPQSADPSTALEVARQLVAEFIGTFAFVFVTVCMAYWWHPDFLSMGLAGGITAAILVAAFARLGSGQFNPAITLGMVVGGQLKLTRALMIIPVQIISAVLACFVLASFLGTNEKMNWIQGGPINEATGQQTVTMLEPVAAATPGIPERLEIPEPIGQVQARPMPGTHRLSVVQAIVLEAMLTFLWGVAVFTGLRQRNWIMTGLLVGGAVAVGVLLGGIFTGGAMNPVRAFGPAVVSGQWNFHLVYWIGPMLGGVLAAVICKLFLMPDDDKEEAPGLEYPVR